jgi:hypothetical protein
MPCCKADLKKSKSVDANDALDKDTPKPKQATPIPANAAPTRCVPRQPMPCCKAAVKKSKTADMGKGHVDVKDALDKDTPMPKQATPKPASAAPTCCVPRHAQVDMGVDTPIKAVKEVENKEVKKSKTKDTSKRTCDNQGEEPKEKKAKVSEQALDKGEHEKEQAMPLAKKKTHVVKPIDSMIEEKPDLGLHPKARHILSWLMPPVIK